MNQQHKFEVANYSRDVLPRINGTEYIKPLGGNATPQSNTQEGELIYRVYELVREIKDFSEKTDFKYVNEEQTSVIRGATQYDIGFENDLKLQSLQKEYNTAFHKELLGSNTQEEFNNLSEVEKLGRQFSAGMKLGPSPVSIVNEFLKDAVKDGKTIETKKYTVTKATVSQAN